MKIEGTATISLEALDQLRKEASYGDEMTKALAGVTEEVMQIYSFDAEEYHKALKEIDEAKNLTDEQISRKVSKAMTQNLRIVINEDALKQLIRRHIDGKESDEHTDILKASDRELKEIKVVLNKRSRQRKKPAQLEEDLCRMCEQYMADRECDYSADESCPAAMVMKELEETREQLKKKDAEVKKLQKQVSDLKWKMSYMTNPMAIGDRCEMGG